jgi:xanthine dehydrogenase YagR molybdenum-binding subunit
MSDKTAEYGPGSRQETLAFGIPGAQAPGAALTTIERPVPENEPPPLPPNKELRVVGKRTSRLDGVLKVTGRAKYTADVQMPGMLYASVVTSTMPHARIKSIDMRAAQTHPGVKAVHVVKRVLGVAVLRDKSLETPSNYPIVRFAGQPLAAVAATSQTAADEAAALVSVEYEPMPFVVDVDDARQPNAPLIYPGPADQPKTAGGGGGPKNLPQHGNVHGPAIDRRGDVDAGFKQADVIVEAEFRTHVQTHCALETHGVVADWRIDGLTAYASTQSTSSVRDEYGAIMDLPENRIRVITEFMGGGFGAKFGAGNPGAMAAELSRQAGAPVRLMMTRKDEHLSTGNRPDSVQRLKIGATKDGHLTAIHLVSFGTGGVGTGAGTGRPATNLYQCDNVLTEESDVFTNAGPAAAFRAPGHPQGCFALEQAIDELAEKLQIDTLELRNRIDTHPARREERRVGSARAGWSSRHAPGTDHGPIKRGLGMAQAIWYRIVNPDSACEVRIGRDGSVEVFSAVQDIGGGIRTALAQVVAEELGLKAAEIKVSIGDTAYPVGPPSGGSMTTTSITPAARDAAFQARQAMAAQIAPLFGVSAPEVEMREGKVMPRADSSRAISFRQAASRFRTAEVTGRASRVPDYQQSKVRLQYGGVQFVTVAVDTGTGVVKVERVVAVHDCGRPLNPLAIESQINGGIIQGISYALYEQRRLDRNTGLMVNPNLESYKIAGAFEVPEIETVILENYLALSSTDAGGIGEPATVPTAAAIANAFANATGVRIRTIPMTPAVVLEALRQEARA